MFFLLGKVQNEWILDHMISLYLCSFLEFEGYEGRFLNKRFLK